MKFYKVQTEEGPQLVGTQAEVKALKQPLVIEEVPTDKDGLAAYVNKLMHVTLTDAESWQVPPAESEAARQIKLMDAVDKPVVAPTLTVEQVQEFILDLDSFHLSNVFAAVIERADRLKREINVNG